MDEATAIAAALKRHVELAGVFVDAHLDDVAATAEALELTLVQLHGDEGPAYCAEVARRTGAKVIKAARVHDRADVRALHAFARPTSTCSTRTCPAAAAAPARRSRGSLRASTRATAR